MLASMRVFRLRRIQPNLKNVPVYGSLSPEPIDKVDGHEEMITDFSRLEPRSDDEDTDFEEDCPCDWINELEKMVDEH